MSDQNPNTALWEAVVKTDPNYTKQFSRGGGFKGTATNVVYLIRKATKQWGPIGGAWGLRIVNEQIIPGHTIEGSTDHEQIHKVQIEVWYPNPAGANGVGIVPAFGQTTFVGSNKNGRYTDEEAPKKSLTDALSKALSWLGFGADIHLGLFDDNKYLNDRRQEFGQGKEATADDAPRAPPSPPPTTNGNGKPPESPQFKGFMASLEELLPLMPEIFPDLDSAKRAAGEAARAFKIDPATLRTSASTADLNRIVQSVKEVGNRKLEAMHGTAEFAGKF